MLRERETETETERIHTISSVQTLFITNTLAYVHTLFNFKTYLPLLRCMVTSVKPNEEKMNNASSSLVSSRGENGLQQLMTIKVELSQTIQVSVAVWLVITMPSIKHYSCLGSTEAL